MNNTSVVVATDEKVGNLVATARSFSDDVLAVVVGDRAVADAVALSGVDRVMWLGDLGTEPIEAFALAVAEAVGDVDPVAVLGSTHEGQRVLVGAVATRLAAPVFSMINSVAFAAGTTTLNRSILGGIAEETVEADGPVILLLEDSAAQTVATAAPVEEPPRKPLRTVKVTETRPATHAAVDLTKARRIVAVGRGLKAADDLALVQSLADALGAELACSRPLAEGLNWFSHDRYVGITGQHVAPELYIAIGISGQLQHVSGCRESGTVVAINTDKNAPYFKECDYGIVGDLYAVVPALIGALK